MLSRCELNATEVEWRPGNVVGEGSFSTVYRGSYCGIDVAVKELKFKLSQVRPSAWMEEEEEEEGSRSCKQNVSCRW